MSKKTIEEQLQEISRKHEIKLTADILLEEFNKTNAASLEKSEVIKTPKKKIPFFKYIVPFTSVAALAIVAIVAINIPLSNSHSESLTGTTSSIANGYEEISQSVPISQPEFKQVSGDTRSQVAFQIYSTLALVDYDNPTSTSTTLTRQLRNPDYEEDYDDYDDYYGDWYDEWGEYDHRGGYHYGASEDSHHRPNKENITFNDITIQFNNALPTVKNLFNNGIEVSNVVEKGTYIGVYDTYEYKMVINDNYTFLSNIAFEEEYHDEKGTIYDGEIVSKNQSNLKVEVYEEKANDGSEEEVYMSIYLDYYTYIEVQQEVENDERTYSYTVYENYESVYEQEIIIKNNNEKKDYCRLEIRDQDLEYSFKSITPTDSGLTSSYKTFDLEGDFTLTYLDSGNEYVENSTSEKIIL